MRFLLVCSSADVFFGEIISCKFVVGWVNKRFTFCWLLESSWYFGCEDGWLSFKLPFLDFCLVIAWTKHIALFWGFKRLAIDSWSETFSRPFQKLFGILLNYIVAWSWIRLNRLCHSLGLRVKRHTFLEEMLMFERRSIDIVERYGHIFFSFALLKSFFCWSETLVLVLLWLILFVADDIVWAWSWLLSLEIFNFPQHESFLVLGVVNNCIECSDSVWHKEIGRILFGLLVDCWFIVWSKVICAWSESQWLMSLEAVNFVLAPISNTMGFLF